MTSGTPAGDPYRWRSPGAIAALLLTAAIVGSNGAHAADAACAKPMGHVVSAQGGVEVLRARATTWQPAPLGTSVCHGDTVRVLDRGRAALSMNNDVVVRLDQRSAVTLAGPDSETPSLLELCRGALHFITRFPRPLRIITPFLNASVEGTEFSVTDLDGRHEVAVMEGRVSTVNSPERTIPQMCEALPAGVRTPGGGSALLTAGQTVSVTPGQAPQPTLLARPADAVQWALYYPPVVDYRVETGPAAWQAAWAQSSRAYREGNFVDALATAARVNGEATDARFYVWRAGLLLQVGRVDEAERDIQQALKLRGADADAYALQSIVAVVRNDKDQALKLARDAVGLAPASSAAHIALSYALQARFRIEDALASAREAVKRDEASGIAWARVAELEMSMGNLRAALTAAERATAVSPRLSRTQTILGFAHLTRIDLDKAKEAFAAAIELDSADPLPRLGNGLALVREGRIEEGRKEIEIAAALDPGNALVRSYLGKAYYEEKRDKLAGTQFDLAKALDPRDSTPWFYEAIMLQAQQRPGGAVQSFDKAAELNDNRAVSRSRLLLDEDRAARSVSVARSFRDLGLESRAIAEASSSLSRYPDDYSAHRLLADLYQTRDRHEFARGSELLQSQLLQPTNPTPVQPHLSFGGLALIPGATTARPGLNEYSTLFERNQVNLLLSGQIGNLGTDSLEGIVSAVQGPIMASAGHFHYDTRGFRPNNDLKHEISTAFAQFAIGPAIAVQVEYRKRHTEAGDLQFDFDPNAFSRVTRTSIDHEATRLGAAITFPDRSKLLLNAIDATREGRSATPIPGFVNFDFTSRDAGQQYEAAYVRTGPWVRLFAGARFQDISTSTRTVVDFTPLFGIACPPPPFQFIPCESVAPAHKSEHSAYAYATITPRAGLDVTLGTVRYHTSVGNFEWNRWSPKIGLRYEPIAGTVLRLASTETIKPFLAVNETLEPTQVAGLNQFFDDNILAKSQRRAAAVDSRLGPRHLLGASASGRTVKTPVFGSAFNLATYEVTRERLHEAYFAWLPTTDTTVKVSANYETYRRDAGDAILNEPLRVTSWIFPATLYRSWAGSFFAGVSLTHVRHEIERLPGAALQSGRDNFTLVDIGLGTRLPQRRGLLKLEVRNLFNQKFSFHDTNFASAEPRNPRFVPTRVILLSIAVTL